MDPLGWNPDYNLSNNDTYEFDLPLLDALDFWPYQVILIILYSTTAFISLGSNIITIIVLIKGNHLSSELSTFLINLAVSDIAMAIFSIPFTYTGFMLGRWVFPPGLCPIVQFAQLCSVFVSVWTLTAIGIDRYFAIIHPFRSLFWIKTHKIIVISIIWLLGIIIGSSQLVKSRAVQFQYGGDHYYDCREEWSAEDGKVYTLFIFFVTFALPVMALIYVYSTIGWHIMKHVIPGNPDVSRDEAHLMTKIKVIKILATIVGLYILFWLPIHIFSLLVWFCPRILNAKTKLEYCLYVGSYFISHFLSMGHSMVNPIIYSFMSENFRSDLRPIFRVCFSWINICNKVDAIEANGNESQLNTQLNSFTINLRTKSMISRQRIDAENYI